MTMRHSHRAMQIVAAIGLTVSLFTGTWVFAADEPPTSPPSAQDKPAQQPDTPPPTDAGDVQERGVSRAAPELTVPLGPSIALSPSPFPGEFVIQTSRGNYLTAVSGGGRTINVIHTDVTGIGPFEKFRFLMGGGLSPGQYAIQTAGVHYLTAVRGGGFSGPAVDERGQPTDPVHTDAGQIGSWETFRFVLDQYGWRNAIQTANRSYLTAVDGGGKTTDAIHTNAVQPGTWEYFNIWKCGDLGSGYQYTISAVSVPYGVLFAYGGGGRVVTRDGVFVAGAIGVLTDYNLRPAPFDNNWQKFRLMRQNDGSYALQTSNGINYVTAIKGGGLSSGTISWDNLVTDRTQVQAWEIFRFVDLGNCTYTIQTVSGHYLGKKTAAPGTVAAGVFSTNVTDIKDATKFRLALVF